MGYVLTIMDIAIIKVVCESNYKLYLYFLELVGITFIWWECLSKSAIDKLLHFFQIWLGIYFKPMEHTSLKRSDVMIITNLTRSPMNNPDTMIGEFCMAAGSFVAKIQYD